jgi:hypothetical protein
MTPQPQAPPTNYHQPLPPQPPQISEVKVSSAEPTPLLTTTLNEIPPLTNDDQPLENPDGKKSNEEKEREISPPSEKEPAPQQSDINELTENNQNGKKSQKKKRKRKK